MSQTTTGTTGMVRVTIASATRRVDLVLPGAVPVAELVPELARAVGVLDAGTVHGGYALLAGDGRPLRPEAGLTVQGVVDGGVLTVAARSEASAPKVYDDVAEAMADVVAADLTPWSPAQGRRTGLWGAALLLLAAAAGLVWQQPSVTAAAVAAGLGVVLTVAAAFLSRAGAERDAAVTCAWLAGGHAAVSGWVWSAAAGHGPAVGAAVAGAAAAACGLVALLALETGRPLALPVAVQGLVWTVVGGVAAVADLPLARVLLVAVVAVVLLGSVIPWVALSATRTREPAASESATDPEPAVDLDRVRRDAATAHDLLLGIGLAVGVLVILATPVLVGLGVAGALVAAACCLLVMLRTRHHHSAAEVAVGVLTGLVGVALLVLAALVLHPDWRPVIGVLFAGVGVVALVLTLLPTGGAGEARKSHGGDLAEAGLLLAILPLAVVALGLVDGLVG